MTTLTRKRQPTTLHRTLVVSRSDGFVSGIRTTSAANTRTTSVGNDRTYNSSSIVDTFTRKRQPTTLHRTIKL